MFHFSSFNNNKNKQKHTRGLRILNCVGESDVYAGEYKRSFLCNALLNEWFKLITGKPQGKSEKMAMKKERQRERERENPWPITHLSLHFLTIIAVSFIENEDTSH